MRLCFFEDNGVDMLEPIALTRPAFDLWCGTSTLLERMRHKTGAVEIGALVRPFLTELSRLQHPDLAINDPIWVKRGPTFFVNARWLPGEGSNPAEDTSPRVGLVGRQVAYVIGSDGPEAFPEKLDDWLETCKKTLPMVAAGGTLVEYLWDLVDLNPNYLAADFNRFASQHPNAPSNLAVVGPAEKAMVAESAAIEPFVTADTRNGPVFIDRGAVVQSFTRLEGPCYVGRESLLLGAKLRGGSIGPGCRVGGEVEASIMQGFSNKYHDGFLGHSYVGSWVNLAAGTQTSDLRNDYGMVKVNVAGLRVATGRTKIGSFIGDHTKTGLGTLLNTGTVIGTFCNVLSSGSLSATVVPSFCQLQGGQLLERWDLRQLFQTAGISMRRRDFDLTDTHRDFFYALYDQTAAGRHKVLRANEYRRMRRSV